MSSLQFISTDTEPTAHRFSSSLQSEDPPSPVLPTIPPSNPWSWKSLSVLASPLGCIFLPPIFLVSSILLCNGHFENSTCENFIAHVNRHVVDRVVSTPVSNLLDPSNFFNVTRPFHRLAFLRRQSPLRLVTAVTLPREGPISKWCLCTDARTIKDQDPTLLPT
ncbi:hypothetical protein PM082_000244 [Marasmius tenuissimus]|nr:hypothetical protein PM082_000244 [Marasmius tenuissimus]